MTSLPVLPLAPPPTRTTFCSAEIRLGDGFTFFVDGNSKITAGNGTYAEPLPNAFSLPAASVSGGAHCPNSTAACRSSCYVRGLAKHVPDLYARYASNAAALEWALACVPTNNGLMNSHITAAVKLGDWIREHARGGFRWHVSGDVQSREHAWWIRSVCAHAVDVPMWIYTRTLGVVDCLVRATNLAVNVSADRDNYAEALAVATRTGARVCYLTTAGEVPADLPAGSVVFPDYGLRGRDLVQCTSHVGGFPDDCGWGQTVCDTPRTRSETRDGKCPSCGWDVEDAPFNAPWWGGLTHAQRKMVCPTDFLGQSEEHRCGPCRKCLVK